MTAITKDSPVYFGPKHDAHVEAKLSHEQRETWERLETLGRERRGLDNKKVGDALQAALSPQATPRAEPAPLNATAQDTAMPAPVVTVAVPQIVKAQMQAKRQTWRDVSWPYIQTVFASGQYPTAKVFYKALLDAAGKGGSPFDKGTGTNAGSLFVRATNKPLALKTVENAWFDIRASRKKG